MDTELIQLLLEQEDEYFEEDVQFTRSLGKEWLKEEPDGTYIYAGQPINCGGGGGYPILSHRYDNRVHSLGTLESPPLRARSFRNVVRQLAERGVERIEFSPLKIFPPRRIEYRITFGNQAVRRYGEKMVIFESKVGVGSSSAGFLAWVGPEEDVMDARGSTYVNSQAALEAILKKLDR